MSALALVLQDASAAAGFSSRKATANGASDSDAAQDFRSRDFGAALDAGATAATPKAGADAALRGLGARQAGDDAATATGGGSASLPRAAAGDAALWRDLAPFASGAPASRPDASGSEPAAKTFADAASVEPAAKTFAATAAPTPETASAGLADVFDADGARRLERRQGAAPGARRFKRDAFRIELDDNGAMGCEHGVGAADRRRRLQRCCRRADDRRGAAQGFCRRRAWRDHDESRQVRGAAAAVAWFGRRSIRPPGRCDVESSATRQTGPHPRETTAAPATAPGPSAPAFPAQAPADPTLASLFDLASKSAAPVPAPATKGAEADEDPVARIGAALASARSPGAFSGATSKAAAKATPAGAPATAPDADVALATPEEGVTTPVQYVTTSVHVVAQQTWLQPVSAAYSPGLSRVAAADRDALDALAAPARSAPAEPTAAKAAPDARLLDARLADAPSPDGASPAALSTALPTPAGAAPSRATIASAAAPASGAAAPGPAPTGLSATPRRDLEITLEPKDLGGLAVRMKSAGDRLEIAFVADKGETARMIADKSGLLESQLHGAGVGLGGIDISASSAGAGGDPAGAGAGRQPSSSPSGGQAGETPQQQGAPGRNRQEKNHDASEKTGELRPGADRGLYL